jgi:hypothetical protein
MCDAPANCDQQRHNGYRYSKCHAHPPANCQTIAVRLRRDGQDEYSCWGAFVKVRSAVRFYSRRSADYTERLPGMRKAFAKLSCARSSGAALRISGDLCRRCERAGRKRASSCPFDLLHQDGVDLRSLTPMMKRTRSPSYSGGGSSKSWVKPRERSQALLTSISAGEPMPRAHLVQCDQRILVGRVEFAVDIGSRRNRDCRSTPSRERERPAHRASAR